MTKITLHICFVPLLIFGVDAGFQDHHAAIERRQSASVIPVECTYADLILSACQILSPGFLTLVPVSKAPCLCYSDTAWAPQLFDGAIETCASWAKTADPVDYPGIATYEGICTSVGDILSANVGPTTPIPVPAPQPVTPKSTSTTPPPPVVVTTPPTPPTPTPTQPPPAITPSPSSSDLGIRSNSGCAFVGSALNFCESITPGFSTLLPSQMATCLCYSSTAWSPGGFDRPVATCAEYVKTASPTDYPVLSGLEDFCTIVGDVINSGSGGGGGGAANTGKPLSNTNAPIFGFTSKSTSPSNTPSITRVPGSSTGVPLPTTITLVPTTTANSSSELGRSPIDGMVKAILLSFLVTILGLLIML
ncbi:hypothetical protein BKA65DRAFT_518372 [Rhexocercosporidium sp. MPI-PUGE-AT-0058]|nr:hypothetical protein BKA65DRAFT_518372 [Rhexocercosporidium sp. MPI-PUGE-AT-0058]